ncbi:MAG TPA: NPCBM/NEW2 domain-containing protein [Lacipirellulaceae bacterium]|nr:NPCBM/NEW2 domain-containing protein [Lacipirellulaceae bacterium]
MFRIQGAVSAAGSTKREFGSDELVRWGHPCEPRPQIFVVLADGGRLITAAAWSGGAPVRLEGDKIVALTDTWGEVQLAKSLVRGLVFAQRHHLAAREDLEETVRDESATNLSLRESGNSSSEIVLLTNKDRVTGKLAALAGGSLTLETPNGAVKLPLSRVEAVVFGGEEAGNLPASERQPPSFVVGTRDGSLVYANGISSDEHGLIIEAAESLTLTADGLDDIALLQSLGGRFDYLSDLEPQGYRHVPYLSIEWPYARDRNVLGEPLSVGGKRYLKGIGMHSAARLTYRLDGQYRRFIATVAIDASAGKRGSVAFGVYVLRGGAWEEAFTSGMVRGGESPRPVSVDVTGAQGLTLTVDFADRGDELDRANWLDARLVKTEM